MKKNKNQILVSTEEERINSLVLYKDNKIIRHMKQFLCLHDCCTGIMQPFTDERDNHYVLYTCYKCGKKFLKCID